MSDKDIKDRIQAATAVLNTALMDAAKAGLTVEIHDLDVSTMGDTVRVLRVEAEVARVTKI